MFNMYTIFTVKKKTFISASKLNCKSTQSVSLKSASESLRERCSCSTLALTFLGISKDARDPKADDFRSSRGSNRERLFRPAASALLSAVNVGHSAQFKLALSYSTAESGHLLT